MLQHHGFCLLQQTRMIQHPIFHPLLEGGYNPLAGLHPSLAPPYLPYLIFSSILSLIILHFIGLYILLVLHWSRLLRHISSTLNFCLNTSFIMSWTIASFHHYVPSLKPFHQCISSLWKRAFSWTGSNKPETLVWKTYNFVFKHLLGEIGPWSDAHINKIRPDGLKLFLSVY